MTSSLKPYVYIYTSFFFIPLSYSPHFQAGIFSNTYTFRPSPFLSVYRHFDPFSLTHVDPYFPYYFLTTPQNPSLTGALIISPFICLKPTYSHHSLFFSSEGNTLSKYKICEILPSTLFFFCTDCQGELSVDGTTRRAKGQKLARFRFSVLYG